MRPEQKIQAKIMEYLKSKGAYRVKVEAASVSGVPDILVCYKAMFIGIEVKKSKNSQPTELQLENINMIRQAGGLADVVSSLPEVDWLLRCVDSRVGKIA